MKTIKNRGVNSLLLFGVFICLIACNKNYDSNSSQDDISVISRQKILHSNNVYTHGENKQNSKVFYINDRKSKSINS